MKILNPGERGVRAKLVGEQANLLTGDQDKAIPDATSNTASAPAMPLARGNVSVNVDDHSPAPGIDIDDSSSTYNDSSTPTGVPEVAHDTVVPEPSQGSSRLIVFATHALTHLRLYWIVVVFTIMFSVLGMWSPGKVLAKLIKLALELANFYITATDANPNEIKIAYAGRSVADAFVALFVAEANA